MEGGCHPWSQCGGSGMHCCGAQDSCQETWDDTEWVWWKKGGGERKREGEFLPITWDTDGREDKLQQWKEMSAWACWQTFHWYFNQGAQRQRFQRQPGHLHGAFTLRLAFLWETASLKHHITYPQSFWSDLEVAESGLNVATLESLDCKMFPSSKYYRQEEVGMANGMLRQYRGIESFVSSPPSSNKARQFEGASSSVEVISLVQSHSVKISWHRGTQSTLETEMSWYLQTLYATLLGQLFPKPRGGEITRNKLYISL